MHSTCSVVRRLASLHGILILLQASFVSSDINSRGEEITIDFGTTADGSPLPRGTPINENVAFQGGVTFKARRSDKIGTNGAFSDAMIFDSANPTGRDFDLGQFPQLGNILIITEDNDSSDPDDYVGGGQIMAEFKTPTMVKSIRFIDIEDEDSTVELLDSTGATVKSLSVPYTGNGGAEVLYFGEDSFVAGIRITLSRSGAIDDIVLKPQCEEVDLPPHCEQRRKLSHSLSYRKISSPPGVRHSQDIVFTQGNATAGTSVGLLYFSNDLVSLESEEPLGLASGHCVQVYTFREFSCYFNIEIRTEERSGRLSVHAHGIFDLLNPTPEMPFCNMIIHGGTGDFLGAVGHGCTINPPGSNGLGLSYFFEYELMTGVRAD